MAPASIHSIATAFLLGSGLIACARVQPAATGPPREAGTKSEAACGGPRRSLAAAVPGDARMALIAERLWSRTAALRDAATALGVGQQYARVNTIASGIAGFDLTDAVELRRHGFDPDSGLALFSFAPDEDPVLVFGISEPALAEQTLLRLLNRLESTRSGAKLGFETVPGASGAHITVGKRAGTEEKTGYLLQGGCLYLRAMKAGDPLPTLLRVASKRSDESLELAPMYREATNALGSSDLLYWLDLPKSPPASRETSSFDSMALATSLLPDSIRLRFWGRRGAESDTWADAFPRQALRSDLAATLPTGALFWAQTSGPPLLLWQETMRNAEMDPARIGEGLKALFGGDADQEMLPSFTGHFGMALYPDAARLQSSDAASPGSRPVLVVVAELVAGKERSIEAVLDRGMEKLSRRRTTPVERRRLGSFPVWRVGGSGAIIAVRDERLFVALDMAAGKRPVDEKDGARAKRLLSRKARPARWPLEATSEELGPLGAILEPQANARSLRDDLGERAAPAAAAGNAFIVSRGAVLNIPDLIQTALRLKGNESAAAGSLESFFRQRPDALRRAVFDWTLRQGVMEGELRLSLPPAAPLTDLDHSETLAVFEFECLTCDDREAAGRWAADIAAWAQKLSPELKVIRPNRLARGAQDARELAAEAGANLAIYAHGMQTPGLTRYRVEIWLVSTRHGGVREVAVKGNSPEEIRKALGESLRQILRPTR
jgi:hypothetical protein